MINFSFGTNGKSIILGVPILKHITVACLNECTEIAIALPPIGIGGSLSGVLVRKMLKFLCKSCTCDGQGTDRQAILCADRTC